MRAIDLYAGIGGWSLGLRLAGIEVIQSYEWWQPAIDTHNGNHQTNLEIADIRKLDLTTLPKNIDLVVGSPPCTQFSFSNRGGSGNLTDGLIDLVKFFEIVDFLKPKYWAMENVPRVASILAKGFDDPNCALYQFRKLSPKIEIFDFSKFGCPQARRRCIATNLPIKKIEEYIDKVENLTLGDVVSAISQHGTITDPIWKTTLKEKFVTEREREVFLNTEELRLNREAKIFHPVYNNMSFPDRLDAPARTVTATCTRVSRESIVVSDGSDSSQFRRLTIRERACLQGFPITYQFFGKSFAEKAKMIGNAIPPTFTYLFALAVQGKKIDDFKGVGAVSELHQLPKKLPLPTYPDGEGKTYPFARRFRAAIPNLRFKSGMRFEFSNSISDHTTDWSVMFFSGNSKNIDMHDLSLDYELKICANPNLKTIFNTIKQRSATIENMLSRTTKNDLQCVWTRRKQGVNPFQIVDAIADLADGLHESILEQIDRAALEEMAIQLVGLIDDYGKIKNNTKLRINSARIISGVMTGVWFNSQSWSEKIADAA